MAEVKVRDLNPKVVEKIDELAKEKGFDSRQQFLKYYIENLSVIDELERQSDKFSETMRQVIVVLEENTSVMKQLREELILD